MLEELEAKIDNLFKGKGYDIHSIVKALENRTGYKLINSDGEFRIGIGLIDSGCLHYNLMLVDHEKYRYLGMMKACKVGDTWHTGLAQLAIDFCSSSF